MGEKLHIHVDKKREMQTCLLCGFATDKVHDYRNRQVKDITCFGKAVLLVVHKRRYCCQCGRSFAEKYSFTMLPLNSSHINEIEGFWGYAKTKLAKFRSRPKSHFYLHLKESEFRFNFRAEDIYRLILKTCRNNPLF